MAATDMFLERPKTAAAVEEAPTGPYGLSDDDLLKKFKDWKRESFEYRWLWERGWMRNIHYVNNRQWIEYVRRSNEWRDVRLAKWFPKPVTNKISEGTMALRAMFASVNIGTNVRPNGEDPKNIAVAAFADEYGPILHEEHLMESVLDEADFWFIVCGNVFLHTYLERDVKYGTDVITAEQCVACQMIYMTPEIVEAQGKCPHCGAMEFVPAFDPETNESLDEVVPRGRGKTDALSPFELAFPMTYARFEDVPYVIRLRWRSKSYYENHPELKAQVAGYKWTKAPSETSLQLFRSLPFHNDMGVAPFLNSGSGGSADEEGAPEYECWVRPCNEYPKGLVFRVLGDSDQKILHLEESEGLPGEIPYRDVDDNAIFTFTHAPFEQRGGRVYGTSPLDGAIQKQNQLNQLDAFVLMIIHRMSNPLWLVPKGAEIEKFTGEPGLVVRWNPLTVGGNAKPERIDGLGPNASLFTIRQQYLQDIEEAMGTYDVLKGQKPAGVEAFSALQLMVERGQSRFASAFKARGGLYKDWFKFALEIEREFGPEQRVRNTLSPARTWTQKVFQRSMLQGSFTVIVEDGSQTPKTTLGQRASIQHLATLGLLDPNDPDQRYKVYQLFGQTKLSPSLDIHMQAALRKQEAFEEWAANPQAQQESLMAAQQEAQQYMQQLQAVQAPPAPAPQVGPDGQPVAQVPPDPAQMQAQLPPPPPLTKHTPLEWLPWYNPTIHKQEFLKWANGDRVIELLKQNPALKELLVAHLAEIDGALAMAAMQQQQAQAGPPKPGGAGRAMQNSSEQSDAGGPDSNQQAV